MSKTPAKKKSGAQSAEAVELVPDAWPRFERFIKQIVKAGPQHREAKPKRRKSKR